MLGIGFSLNDVSHLLQHQKITYLFPITHLMRIATVHPIDSSYF